VPLEIAATHHVSMRSDFLIAEGLGGTPLRDNPEGVGCSPEVINPQALREIRLANDVNHLITITSV
jgi:hypothetical protein